VKPEDTVPTKQAFVLSDFNCQLERANKTNGYRACPVCALIPESLVLKTAMDILARDAKRFELGVYRYDGVFSSAKFAPLGGVERLGQKRTRRKLSSLEDILRHCSPGIRELRNSTGIGLFLFLLSQWR
jgi:hypothetical protein